MRFSEFLEAPSPDHPPFGARGFRLAQYPSAECECSDNMLQDKCLV